MIIKLQVISLLVRILSVLLLAPLATTLVGGAQDIPLGFLLRHWDDGHGLPANTVTAMVQSHDGYLWVGTPNGLTRFDGESFLNTVSTPLRFLRGHEIVSLAEDHQGTLWIVTKDNGLFCFTNGPLATLPIQESKAAVNCLAIDPSNGVLVAFADGRIRQCKSGQWLDFVTNGLPSQNISHLVFDANGELWCLAGGHPVFKKGMRWLSPAVAGFHSRSFDLLASARRGGVWLAANIAPNNQGFEVLHLQSDENLGESSSFTNLLGGVRSRITTLTEDRTGCLWLGTFGGGVFYHPLSGEWKQFTDNGPLAELIVFSIVAGDEDSIWLGMQAGGLYQIRRAPVTALHLPVSARQNVVQCACGIHDGSVWVGTDGAGAFHYKEGKFTQYRTKEGLPDLNVGVLLEDSRSNLWAGTGHGLVRFDGTTFQKVNVPGISDVSVLSLLEDHQGCIWAGTQDGVVRVTTDEVSQIGPVKGLPLHVYIALAEDKDGRIWAAAQGVGLFYQTSAGFKQFAPGQWPEEKSVRSLWCDHDNVLWVACYNKGLVQIKNGKIRRWTMADGLVSDGIHGIIEDGSGNLWMASDNGVFACAKSQLENYRPDSSQPLLCRRVSIEDGLASKVCTGYAQPMIGYTPDGRFWFPNRQALAVFNPRKLPSRPPLCLPVVNQILADEEPLTLVNNQARTSARVRRLEFHYTAPDLMDGERLSFCYWLQGADEGWVDAGKRRVAYYNQLPPGRYQLKLKMGGPDGQWVEAPREFVLVLLPQWWQIRWVQAFLVLSAAGCIAAAGWGVARARARRKLLEYEMRSEVDSERRRIAQDLHDELGAGFTHLMLLADAVNSVANLPKEAQGGTKQISSFSRELASTTDQIVWTLNPRNDSLPNLIGYLSDFAQTLLQASTVTCRLDISPELPDLVIGATMRHNLLLAFKEAINNAIKHAHATEVWVRIRMQSNELSVVIEDNGAGFDPRKPSEGNGLLNMRERIEKVGGRTEIITQERQGTRVMFVLWLGLKDSG